MHLARVSYDGKIGTACKSKGLVRVMLDQHDSDLDGLIRKGPEALRDWAKACEIDGALVAEEDLGFLPPLIAASKIICVGLNYHDHAAEMGFVAPDFPTLFARFGSSLIGHNAPIIKPAASDELDYEGEMVAVIGKGGRYIPVERACEHVVGYSIFNDASIRDFQLKTPQWTAGKNFDGTGAFGPWLITADELPMGASGLRIETRLNGITQQSASTSDMIFDVANLVSILSSFMTLEVGDVIVTGTPAGVGGLGRNPPLYMKDGDVCEVEIEGIGLLRNPVRAE